MGATKRFAELILQAYSQQEKNRKKTRMTMVRFGNVLGSSGSAVPLFQKQIREGGPITVTHPEVIRYFMSIPEAAELVVQAGAMGEGGDVFVLDMGEPVKIVELAENLIKLNGLHIWTYLIFLFLLVNKFSILILLSPIKCLFWYIVEEDK